MRKLDRIQAQIRSYAPQLRSYARHRTVLVAAGVLAAATLFAILISTTARSAEGFVISAVDAPRVTPSPQWEGFDLPEPGPVEFTFVAAGDVLPHGSVVTSATSGSTIDFSRQFAPVKPFIAGADLAICHMEVPVSPDGRYSGWPLFSAPAELVRDLGESGWDGCTTASNHSLDRGWDGLVTTLNTFDKYRLGHAGTARTKAESTQAQIYKIRADGRVITVANVSYTYGLNGLPTPSGKSWSANTFSSSSSQSGKEIIAAATRAREAGADVVIVSLHCCFVEYVTTPTSDQKRVAKQLAESGQVDLLVGHHAHVPQPIELLKGGPHGEGMWAAHGLGNFISNQYPGCCGVHSQNGILLTASFTVGLDGHVAVDVEWTATTVDRSDKHKVYVLSEITAKGTSGISASEARRRYDLVASVVGNDASERKTPADSRADATYIEPRKPWSATP